MVVLFLIEQHPVGILHDPNNKGTTPLMVATSGGGLDIVEGLVAADTEMEAAGKRDAGRCIKPF